MRAMILTWGLSVGRDLPEGSDERRVTRSFIGQRRPERRAVFGVRQRIDARRSSVPQPSLDFAHQCAGDAATPVIGMNRKPVDMAAPLIPPPEDGAHTLACRLSDEKEATRLLDEQPQPLGRVRDRWSNTCEPPQRKYRVTVLVLALTDAEAVHSGGVIRSAIGEYQPEVYEANSPAGETEGSSLVAARLLRTPDANGGHFRRSPWRAHGNGPRAGCAKIPSATVARIICNFTDREGGSGIGQIRTVLAHDDASAGSGNGQFSYPRGVAANGSGNVYVADSGNNQ